MEIIDGDGFSVVGHSTRKKRSDTSRKPRLDSQTLLQSNHFLLASTEIFTNGGHDKDQSDEGKGVACDGVRSENKLKTLKLKVGGVTRTIHAKSATHFASPGGSSIQASCSSSTASLHQDDRNGNHSFSLDKRKGFGIKWNNISKPDSISQKEHASRRTTVNYEPVRKSNRVPKRRVLDIGFNEDVDDKDEEIRYLKRLNAPKYPGCNEDGSDFRSQKEPRIFKGPRGRVVMDVLHDDAVGNYGSSRLAKEFRKKDFEDIDNVEEEEPISDAEPGCSGKNLKRESPNLYAEGWNESTPTTCTRASAGSVDLSNCLLSSNSRRKKEKPSEVDQQLQKAEAAQRRRMQSEKSAREAEAEAIRKILGQDSGRKKRREKMKKQRDELLQGKANSHTLTSNTIRWVNSPTGMIVTFSEDIGLPSIFNPVPCSYPPPRERCAGPNCTNAYKYRDSKLNLPLCSLQCYKAIHKNVQPLVTF